MAFAEPVTLTGNLVRLEPLTPEHHDGLVDAACDGELWTLSYTSVPRPEDMRAQIEAHLAEQRAGTRLPFVTVDLRRRRVIGITTYLNIAAANRRLEIGYTWNARSAQRTGTNTESKLLLLGHAFEELHCLGVEFRTHWLNRQSRAAIERLGAKLDGVLRQHQIMPDGSLRDTCVYSLIDSEWPAVRAELTRRLTS